MFSPAKSLVRHILLVLSIVPSLFLVWHGAQGAVHVRQFYSTNWACSANRCVNPVFPAFRLLGQNVLETQESRKWTCVDEVPGLGGNNAAINYKSHTKFCERVLDYNFAVPDFVEGESNIETVMEMENRRAVEAYISQVDGFGLETTENNKPWLLNYTNPCIYSIWKLSCYTYFPKCGSLNHKDKYLRPCRGGCESYIGSCGVQCCDEGVQCVFEHKEQSRGGLTSGDGEYTTLRGYVDHMGPSMFCTGSNASGRMAGGSKGWSLLMAFSFLLVLFSSMDVVSGFQPTATGVAARTSRSSRSTRKVTLEASESEEHGRENASGAGSENAKNRASGDMQEHDHAINASAKGHTTGALEKVEMEEVSSSENKSQAVLLQTNAKAAMKVETQEVDISGQHLLPYWRRQPDFTKALQAAIDPISNSFGLSSCNNKNIPAAYKCSMHGVCVAWDDNDAAMDSFRVCKCNSDYGGMECKVKKKKRITAYMLSVFLGAFGFEQFYMGFYANGCVKMALALTVVSLGLIGLFVPAGMMGAVLAVWWTYDVVLIGSGDVYASAYRLAPSIGTQFIPPVLTPMIFMILGFVIAILTAASHIRRKRRLEAEILRKYDIAELTTFKNDLGGLPEILRTAFIGPTEKWNPVNLFNKRSLR